MTLHPLLEAWLGQTEVTSRNAETIEEAREQMLERTRAVNPNRVGACATEDMQVTVRDGGNIPIRVYRPADLLEVPSPVIVFFHGGAWILGDLETHDIQVRALANATACVVISVDYRLAPECQFPTALDDCYDVTAWISAHAEDLNVDTSRLVVAGDSAGGNLAAAVTLQARDQGGPSIAYQLLIYPVTDAYADAGSRVEFATGYFLEQKNMLVSADLYLGGAYTGREPEVSPLLALSLEGLPPAHVITAGYDILRDEGIAYAKKLQSAGVETTLINYPDMIHGFFGMVGGLDRADQACEAAAHDIKRAIFATE